MSMMQAATPSDSVPDEEEFERFYREAWPGAVRLAGLLTQDADAAEDLAQEAFARMYPKWRRAEFPKAYLRTTLVNVCHNWHRQKTTERTKLPILIERPAAEFAFDELADAVAALPYRQRVVLVMRYHAGLSEAQIADALGCRPGTVKSLASRALEQLKKGIEQ
jgi:RNA polymerase sigma-70 factor (sigma-E family)